MKKQNKKNPSYLDGLLDLSKFFDKKTKPMKELINLIYNTDKKQNNGGK